MKETKQRESDQPQGSYWLDHPGNVKKVIRIFFFCCGVLALLDLIFIFQIQHKHVYFPDLENKPGFFCLYGLVACVLLVLVAKQLRKLLMRPENYYETSEGLNTEPSNTHHD